MVFTKKGSNITFDEEGNEVKDTDDDDSFSNTLIQLQGDTNAGKIMEVTLESDEEKPEIINLNSQNYDKEFTVTDASVVERIYSAYGQEHGIASVLVKSDSQAIFWKMPSNTITLSSANNNVL